MRKELRGMRAVVPSFGLRETAFHPRRSGALMWPALLLLAGACGGGGLGGGSLDSDFTGQWSPIDDQTAVSAPGCSTGFAGPGQLIIAVDGGSMTVDKLCANNDDEIEVTGNGSEASWAGSFACPVYLTATDSRQLTLSSLEFQLDGGGIQLSVQGTGVFGNDGGPQCPAAVTFFGARQ